MFSEADWDNFRDDVPCPCGTLPGGFHHWECSYEVCPWADEHPEDGEQLLFCGCYEQRLQVDEP